MKVFPSLIALLAGFGAWVVLSAGASAPPGSDAELDPQAAQLARGAEVYAFSCTTCHGATGRGFAEARAAFPSDHYQCQRCHMPLNPPVMTPLQIEQTQSVFSLGDAPALADPHAISRFGTAQGLYAYVRSTMPRWDPGRLEDDAYLDVTAFVLDLAGLLPEGATLEPDALADVRLEVR